MDFSLSFIFKSTYGFFVKVKKLLGSIECWLLNKDVWSSYDISLGVSSFLFISTIFNDDFVFDIWSIF